MASKSTLRKFPGRCCPGLIEAVPAVTDAIVKARGFRGVVAPASLKPSRRSRMRLSRHAVSGALLPRPH